MNYPTKDSLAISQIQEYNFNSNTNSNNSQILDDHTRNLGSIKDEKFDIATKDNVKEKNNLNIKDRLIAFALILKKFLGFVGPGYVIAVGYLDPGNWATDLTGGSKYGYSLLFIIFCSNLFAMLLQGLAIKLGVVTGMDLAQACKQFFPKYPRYFLYVLCELAIIATDLAEVIGSAIALKMLFNLPLPWGVALTALDVMIILLVYRDNSMNASRILESLVMLLVGAVGICFLLELVYSQPTSVDVLKGYLPSSGIFTNAEQLYISIGIIGATVMPHNLYLHSHLVKVRKYREQDYEIYNNNKIGRDIQLDKKTFKNMISKIMKLSIIDSSVALSFALFVNSSILIVASANFFYKNTEENVATLFDAHDLLSKYLGKPAGIVFALALLIAGQSSTLTATIAGQIVMEGFMGWKIRAWVRRLLTRTFAIVPAMIIAIVSGENGLNDTLVASQVALSIQLPFAVIPLVYFTSSKKCMKVNIREIFKKDESNVEKSNEEESNEEESNDDGNNNDDNNDDNITRITVEQVDENPFITFPNTIIIIIIACIVSVIILGLDVYLIYETIKGAIQGTL
ncbi:natural resistance-associated macrophage protein [Glomus cerebriforme]|uniref:Natural resistance-associated macrophage protein n=1 Tax=Glomus cerebriforme TaxID=658196 RepID=A0A397T694_9GLOM|nr:natural resistance-associated macrophage protein [Glomus cerebriforme]